MTVYIWLPHENGREGVIAIDRRRTVQLEKRVGKRVICRGRKIERKATRKLNIVSDNLTYVCSGPVDYREQLAVLVEEHKENPLELYLRYERLVRRIVNRHGFNEPFSFLTIFAGIPGEVGVRAYSTVGNSQGTTTMEVQGLTVGGSGGRVARVYAEKHWQPTMSLEDTVQIAYRAIDEAGESVDSCKYADVAIVTMNGIQVAKR